MGNGALHTCRWVQNGPGSCGFHNLGSNVGSGRNPALADGVDCMTSLLLSLESQGASSANCILHPFQRVVGQ